MNPPPPPPPSLSSSQQQHQHQHQLRQSAPSASSTVTSTRRLKSTATSSTVTSSSSTPMNTMRLADINPKITCRLCSGYLIDATTVLECGNTFCRSCILNHIANTSPYCPACTETGQRHLINLEKDHLKLDVQLQNIIYKLVPNLHQREMGCRRKFYASHPDIDKSSMTPEERGDIRGAPRPDDRISLVLEYGVSSSSSSSSTSSSSSSSVCISGNINNSNSSNNNNSSSSNATKLPGSSDMDVGKRYLLCMAGMPVVLLKKFIAKKYALIDTDYAVDIMYEDKILDDSWTLIDVSFCHGHREPIPLLYHVTQKSNRKAASSSSRMVTMSTETTPAPGKAVKHKLEQSAPEVAPKQMKMDESSTGEKQLLSSKTTTANSATTMVNNTNNSHKNNNCVRLPSPSRRDEPPAKRARESEFVGTSKLMGKTVHRLNNNNHHHNQMSNGPNSKSELISSSVNSKSIPAISMTTLAPLHTGSKPAAASSSINNFKATSPMISANKQQHSKGSTISSSISAPISTNTDKAKTLVTAGTSTLTNGLAPKSDSSKSSSLGSRTPTNALPAPATGPGTLVKPQSHALKSSASTTSSSSSTHRTSPSQSGGTTTAAKVSAASLKPSSSSSSSSTSLSSLSSSRNKITTTLINNNNYKTSLTIVNNKHHTPKQPPPSVSSSTVSKSASSSHSEKLINGHVHNINAKVPSSNGPVSAAAAALVSGTKLDPKSSSLIPNPTSVVTNKASSSSPSLPSSSSSSSPSPSSSSSTVPAKLVRSQSNSPSSSHSPRASPPSTATTVSVATFVPPHGKPNASSTNKNTTMTMTISQQNPIETRTLSPSISLPSSTTTTSSTGSSGSSGSSGNGNGNSNSSTTAEKINGLTTVTPSNSTSRKSDSGNNGTKCTTTCTPTLCDFDDIKRRDFSPSISSQSIQLPELNGPRKNGGEVVIIGVTTSVDQKNDADHHRLTNRISPKARSEEMNSPPLLDYELLFGKSKSQPLSPTFADPRCSPFNEGKHSLMSYMAISTVCKLDNDFGKVMPKISDKNGKKPVWTAENLKELKERNLLTQNDLKIANSISKTPTSPKNIVGSGKNSNSTSSETLIQSDPINLSTHNRV
ncbi:uncharacterized protein LOC141856538 isoform X2 [Brevipalpus obovatus]|uniref:uncharacterized protein LOC141856538 isoform X2 n=1 Tax=Brevipalpus obovatus TaxID=246614 RepID=UPI003D9F5517